MNKFSMLDEIKKINIMGLEMAFLFSGNMHY